MKRTRPYLSRLAQARIGSDLAGSTRGAVLVELALTLPILLVLLLGILTYGVWFMVAHSVQQLANDAARAAIAGLDESERQTIVTSSIVRGASATGTLNPAGLSITTARDGKYYTVRITYAVTNTPIFSASLLPLPSSTIRRAAVVELTSL